ncbi:MAG TPA: pyrimidine dimer DNA glycosylase/endonuclease V [Vitreimonas sp.]|nr:pyrimidine dimer DNA glycosylase/endonuclease V [Vitreimonas sp.]
MRLWSLHPSYLDTKGLLAVWREGLLALHVLRGQTKGYTNHPQLIRFKNHPQPIAAVSTYLHAIVDEAERRNFSFNREKLESRSRLDPLTVTTGQLQYETQHLKNKLQLRDQNRFFQYESITQLDVHPLFIKVPGEIEVWEKVGIIR